MKAEHAPAVLPEFLVEEMMAVCCDYCGFAKYRLIPADVYTRTRPFRPAG
jgi:hypothetical protein